MPLRDQAADDVAPDAPAPTDDNNLHGVLLLSLTRSTMADGRTTRVRRGPRSGPK
jgi:hypothetical protein